MPGKRYTFRPVGDGKDRTFVMEKIERNGKAFYKISEISDPFHDDLDHFNYLLMGVHYHWVGNTFCEIDPSLRTTISLDGFDESIELQPIYGDSMPALEPHLVHFPETEIFSIYTLLSFEALAIEQGTYEKCMKLQKRTYRIPTWEEEYSKYERKLSMLDSECYFYIAPGTGLIRIEAEDKVYNLISVD